MTTMMMTMKRTTIVKLEQIGKVVRDERHMFISKIYV